MKSYTVADSEESIRRNLGVEIMASSFDEARDKAEMMNVPCRIVHPLESVAKDIGDSYYTITDGTDIRDLECEYMAEARISIGAGEGDA